jgi:nucleolin
VPSKQTPSKTPSKQVKKEESSDSEESSSEEEENEKNKVPVNQKPAKKTPSKQVKKEESDNSSEESDEDDKTSKKKLKENEEEKEEEEEEEKEEEEKEEEDEEEEDDDDSNKKKSNKMEIEKNNKSKKRKAEIENEDAVENKKVKQETTKIFVGNLSFKIDEATIREAFQDIGEIKEIKWLEYHDSGRFKGSAILDFGDSEIAKKALSKNGVEVMERPMKVELSIPKNKGEGLSQKVEGCDTVFIGKLSYDVTDEHIHELFQNCGKIKEIRWLNDAQGNFKGAGFVQFEDPSSVDKAVEFNGYELLGRTIHVDFATPSKNFSNNQKSPRGGNNPKRGGRGGGRGGGGNKRGNKFNSPKRGSPAFKASGTPKHKKF